MIFSRQNGFTILELFHFFAQYSAQDT